MKGSLHPERIHIYITTFEQGESGSKPKAHDTGMEKTSKIRDSNKFICSVCLSNRHETADSEGETAYMRTESCPACRRHFDRCQNHTPRKLGKDNRPDHSSKSAHRDREMGKVQATQTDIAQGFSLLNEVLNVFQNHKSEDTKLGNRNHSQYRDVATTTVCRERTLTVCNLFRFSVTDDKNSLKDFVVLSSKCPTKPNIEPVVCLIKQKSSSIPQMKIDEIRSSLKEKTKSKDAVDEVNRMFATVRKSDFNETLDSSNRPMLNNAPGVLPVAKSKKSDLHKNDYERENVYRCGHRSNIFYLSGGDGSPRKHKCCGDEIEISRSPKYCHFQKKSKFTCHCENGNTRPFACCSYNKTPTHCRQCQEREVCSDTSAGNY